MLRVDNIIVDFYVDPFQDEQFKVFLCQAIPDFFPPITRIYM